MLYSVMVYKVSGSKRKKLYSMEIQARDEINALEKANVRLTLDRIIEISEVHIHMIKSFIERPKVKRVAREGWL
jgi:hypothetical protein